MLSTGALAADVAALGSDPDRLLASESPLPGEARKLLLASTQLEELLGEEGVSEGGSSFTLNRADRSEHSGTATRSRAQSCASI